MASGAALITAATLCCVLAMFSSPVYAKRVRGSLPDSDRKKDKLDDWKFITRFCFLSEEGKFHFVFKYPKSLGMQQLLLYFDAPGLWEKAYRSSKNCSERRKFLTKSYNQIIDLTNTFTGSRSAGCEEYTQNGVAYFNCTDTVNFRSARERWWYMVIAHCDEPGKPPNTVVMDYELHLTNGPENDFLHHELSADEFYILPTDISFFLVYWILFILSCVCAVKLKNRQMLHTTYKMYMTALALWLFGLFLQCIAWGRYSETGWEEGPTEVTGRIFRAASTTVFLLMLILMAKGFTITRGRLTQMSSIRLTAFFCIYSIVHIVLFIWEGTVFDEGWVLYYYESEPGYGLIGLQLCGWLWFTYAFAFTIKHHRNKSSFYIPFYIFYTLWFWAGPIVILVAIFSIAPWARQKTVNGVELLVALCGHIFFLVLTRPSAANSNFPFHLRVTQVRFSEDDAPEERYEVSEESERHLNSLFMVSGPAEPSAPPINAMSGRVANGTSLSGTSKGFVNDGYSGYIPNGHNPQLDQMFTIQRNGQLPPLATTNTPAAPPRRSKQVPPPVLDGSSAPSAYMEMNGTLPKDETSVLPSYDEVSDTLPKYEAVAQASPLNGEGDMSPSSGIGDVPLPPLAGSYGEAPSSTDREDQSQLAPLNKDNTATGFSPLSDQGEDVAPPLADDEDRSHLPPLNSDNSDPHLPPLSSDSRASDLYNKSHLPPSSSEPYLPPLSRHENDTPPLNGEEVGLPLPSLRDAVSKPRLSPLRSTTLPPISQTLAPSAQDDDDLE